MQKRPTAADVAKLAGVSRATVSRAFSPSEYVAEETRAKIKEAAEALGFKRNALARALITQETDLVAVVSGKMTSMYDAHLFNALTHKLQENQKWGLLVHADEQDVGVLLGEALSYPVQAVILRSGNVEGGTIEQCKSLGVPLIVIGMADVDIAADFVCIDNQLGARMAVERLMKIGKRRIAYIGGDKRLYSEIARQEGFRKAMNEFQLDILDVQFGDFTFESGFEVGSKMLASPNRPDGVFCANDAMAVGLLAAAQQITGLSIPDDLAIIGFDDIPMASWPCFQVTTIRNPVMPTAEEVVRLLALRQSTPEAPSQVVQINPELVLRNSA
ncbi:LacI family DNA-binding transcriptional regulator [Ruegeria lacuscaerulensis]|uniref:LacI family DNA-binding transcriptional regulator n=1 Tax=Ruegeria lacuscaerulensis TaxID=55218 RepID=UPI0014814E56|nr:LacI family DNA-binding transcriptional regulator [Ruegeria lacuscaerulensis]